MKGVQAACLSLIACLALSACQTSQARKDQLATICADPNNRQLACCRFRGHRDWVFHEAGGGICSDGNLGVSSRSRRFA